MTSFKNMSMDNLAVDINVDMGNEGLAEPDYYADNGFSPLQAFKKGLLSREEYKGFLKGNIIKYVIRCDKKGTGSGDMVKCIDYCQHLKDLLELEMAEYEDKRGNR